MSYEGVSICDSCPYRIEPVRDCPHRDACGRAIWVVLDELEEMGLLYAISGIEEADTEC